MKGIRFYLEYPSARDKRRATRKEPGVHFGTVIAIFTDTWQINGSCWMADGLGGTHKWPNSPTCSHITSDYYLRERCKRISEAQAREIHPALFERLDNE